MVCPPTGGACMDAYMIHCGSLSIWYITTVYIDIDEDVIMQYLIPYEHQVLTKRGPNQVPYKLHIYALRTQRIKKKPEQVKRARCVN